MSFAPYMGPYGFYDVSVFWDVNSIPFDEKKLKSLLKNRFDYFASIMNIWNMIDITDTFLSMSTPGIFTKLVVEK